MIRGIQQNRLGHTTVQSQTNPLRLGDWLNYGEGCPQLTHHATLAYEPPAVRRKLLKDAKPDKADTETTNAIAVGTLLIKAKIGELMPKSKGGRGKENPTTKLSGFSKPTITSYRKIDKHEPCIHEYREKVDTHNTENPNDVLDITAAGFLNYVDSDGNLKLIADRPDPITPNRPRPSNRDRADTDPGIQKTEKGTHPDPQNLFRPPTLRRRGTPTSTV